MIGVIVYHKNASTIYRQEWIDRFRQSILDQTHTQFVIYELNYGGQEERIFLNSFFESKEMPTFVHAMNYLLKKAYDDGCVGVANTNVDDFYSKRWIELQSKCLAIGYDIVSSNFTLIDEEDKEWVRHSNFHDLDIKTELSREHNIISHPSVTYSRKFLSENEYDPELIPYEDLRLWQKAIYRYKFLVLPDNLLWHRIHGNSVCKSTNR